MDWLGILSWLFGTLFFITTIALILVILIQRPKGGGLAGAFGGGGASSQSAFGAKTGDMLTVATVAIFVLFLLLSIGLVRVNAARFSARNAEAPAAPTELTATAPDAASVNLKWVDNSDDEDGFSIWRSPDGVTGWLSVGDVDQDITYFADSKLKPETKYFYRVQARNQVGTSAFTDIVPVTTPKAKPEETPAIGGQLPAPGTGSVPGFVPEKNPSAAPTQPTDQTPPREKKDSGEPPAQPSAKPDENPAQKPTAPPSDGTPAKGTEDGGG